MFALCLWFLLGWRVAVFELLVEVAIGVAFLSGGGGKRALRRLPDSLKTALRAMRPALQQS